MTEVTRTITVYTKDDCRQCDMTKKWLKSRNVEFAEVDIFAEPKTLDAIKALGHLAAPVVVVSQGTPGDEVSWSGFNPPMLGEHIMAAAN